MNAHSLRVAPCGRTLTIRQAGLCHDMVEDGFCSLEDVRSIFGHRMATIVQIVTRKMKPSGTPAETYDEFNRVCESGDTDAIEVKLEDNGDNSDRCKGLYGGRVDLEFLNERYQPAREKLIAALKRRSPMVYQAWAHFHVREGA